MVCCDIACISIQRIDHCFKKNRLWNSVRQPTFRTVCWYVCTSKQVFGEVLFCLHDLSDHNFKTTNKKLSHTTIPCTNIWVQTPHNMYRFSTWIHVRLFIWLFSMRSNAFVFLECIKIAFLYIFGLQACYMDVRASYSHGIWFLHSDTDSLTGQSLVCPAFDTKSAYQHDFKIFN